MILDGVISLLVADSGINTALSGGMYKNVLPRGVSFPALCAHRYGGTREYQFSGPVGVREDQIQLDIYADDAETAQTIREAIRVLLDPYVGTMPDSTVVQACYLERDMDMPFLATANQKGMAFRSTLGYRIVSKV